MKRAAFVIVLLLGLTGFLVWWFQPAQVVKRRTNTLLEILTLDEGTGSSIRQMGGYSINKLLAPEVELESSSISQANGSFERHELESAYTSLCNRAKFSRFSMAAVRLIDIDGDTARVDCSVDALVELPEIRPADGRYDCSFVWIRADDGWRLTKAVWDPSEK